MGVSSLHSCEYSCLSSAFSPGTQRGYAVANNPVAETLDVNHSPVAKRCDR